MALQTRVALVILALAFLPAGVWPAPAPRLPTGQLAAPRTVPFILCPRGPAPRVDGKLDEAEWRLGAPLSPFVKLGGRAFPQNQTDCVVLHDGKAMYLGVRLHVSDPKALQAKAKEHDGDVLDDDSLEVFLDVVGNGRAYCHVALNASGTTYDALNKDKSADFEWSGAVGREEKAWTVEIRFPFAPDVAPGAGTEWRMAVARHDTQSREFSAWCDFAQSFHEPSRFGVLRFSDQPVSVKTTVVDVGALSLGKSQATLSLSNESPKRVAVKVNARVENPGEQSFYGFVKAELAPGATKRLSLDYEGTRDGQSPLILSVLDTQTGEHLFRTASFPVIIPEVAERVYAAEATLRRVLSAAQPLDETPRNRAIAGELDGLTERWRGISAKFARRLTLSVKEYEALGAQADKLHSEAERTLKKLEARGAEGAPAGAIKVSCQSALKRVWEDSFDLPAAEEVSLEACRNEEVSAQLVVAPLAGAVRGLKMDLLPLTGPSGATIPATAWRLCRVDYVPASDPRTGRQRRWPDVLRPLAGSEELDLPADTVTPFWLTLRIPATAAPGMYSGQITVSATGASAIALPVKVEVHDLLLPSPTQFAFSLDFWQNWGRLVTTSPSVEPWSEPHWNLIELYVRDLAEHGQDFVTVGQSFIDWQRTAAGRFAFDFSRFDRYVELCRAEGIDEGIEYLSMFGTDGTALVSYFDEAQNRIVTEKCSPGDESYDRPWGAFLKEFAAHLRAKGWLDKTYVCPTDEPRDTSGTQVLSLFEHACLLLKQADPGFKTTATLESVASARRLAPLLDRLVLRLDPGTYSREFAQSQLAKGKRVDWYICVQPDRPNTFITSHPLEPRLLPWLTFREGLNGLLRWSYTAWPTDPFGHPAGEGKFPPGDLFIVYPGPRGPLSTPRWERLRDGQEDYELLSMLRKAILLARGKGQDGIAATAQHQLDHAVEQVTGPAGELHSYTTDPAKLRQARRDVIATLLMIREVADLYDSFPSASR